MYVCVQELEGLLKGLDNNYHLIRVSMRQSVTGAYFYSRCYIFMVFGDLGPIFIPEGVFQISGKQYHHPLLD